MGISSDIKYNAVRIPSYQIPLKRTPKQKVLEHGFQFPVWHDYTIWYKIRPVECDCVELE